MTSATLIQRAIRIGESYGLHTHVEATTNTINYCTPEGQCASMRIRHEDDPNLYLLDNLAKSLDKSP